jgi:hypothetical protein
MRSIYRDAFTRSLAWREKAGVEKSNLVDARNSTTKSNKVLECRGVVLSKTGGDKREMVAGLEKSVGK